MQFSLGFSGSKEILQKIRLNAESGTLKPQCLRIFLITILPFILFENRFQLTEHHTASVTATQICSCN